MAVGEFIEEPFAGQCAKQAIKGIFVSAGGLGEMGGGAGSLAAGFGEGKDVGVDAEACGDMNGLRDMVAAEQRRQALGVVGR